MMCHSRHNSQFIVKWNRLKESELLGQPRRYSHSCAELTYTLLFDTRSISLGDSNLPDEELHGKSKRYAAGGSWSWSC